MTTSAWLKNFAIWYRKNRTGSENQPCPEMKIAVVGDIHGRFDLLENLLRKLRSKEPDATLVFVGDYVDRGPKSRNVLQLLQKLPPPVCCLMGNHEAMLLDFLDDPIENGARWLRHGGIETLNSFDISVTIETSATSIRNAHAELSEKLADGTEAWLRSLPLIWKSGNVVVTHAGPDPSKPIDQQENQSFLWGHKRFLRELRTDGIWVAHGHWITNKATSRKGRVAVDTGAYQSNILTAAILSPDSKVRYLEA